jgi:ubiquinone/menaquinone biosynthesis C-methylase UbiE
MSNQSIIEKLMEKEEQWKGYYNYYLSEASRKGVNALQVLDEQWYDGRKTAQCVFPDISRESIVLEIACGIGRVSRFVAPRCRHLYCTDILEEALKEARQNLKDFPNVSFHKTNGYDLGEFRSEYFDCVYSFTTFFHFDFELVVHYFREIKRVLKRGGSGIIEFKRWIGKEDVVQLVEKIESRGGIKTYETDLDKWRYVSTEMLSLVCEYYDLRVIDEDTTKFTFRKPNS